MSWQIVITVHLFLDAVFALVYRKTAKDFPGTAFLSNAMMYVTAMGPAAVVWALVFGDVSFDLSAEIWFFVATNTILFAASNVTAFAASSVVDAAQFNIIRNLRTVTTIFFSSIILSEVLTIKQMFGVVLLLSAALLVASVSFNRQTKRIDRHTFLAIVSALLWGVWTVNEKYLLDNMSFSTALLLGWGVQAIIMAPFIYRSARSQARQVTQRQYVKWNFLTGLVRALSGVAFLYALRESGNASLFSSVLSYKTVLIVLGSYFILKEKDNVNKKIAGAVLATAGLLLFA